MSESIEELIRQLRELRVKESEIIARIEAATRQPELEPIERYEKVDDYNIGDRVVVSNRVTRPHPTNPRRLDSVQGVQRHCNRRQERQGFLCNGKRNENVEKQAKPQSYCEA